VHFEVINSVATGSFSVETEVINYLKKSLRVMPRVDSHQFLLGLRWF